MGSEPQPLPSPLPRQALLNRAWLAGVGTCCLLIGALFIWAVRGHARNGLEKLSAVELAEYRQWVDTPLNLPTNSLTAPQLPPLQHLDQRLELLMKFDRVSNLVTSGTETDADPCDTSTRWEHLTAQANESLLREMPPLMTGIKKLTGSPYYSVIPRLLHPKYKLGLSYDLLQMENGAALLDSYIKLTATEKNFDAALDGLDVLLCLLHCDAYVPYQNRRNYTMLLTYALNAAGVIETNFRQSDKLAKLHDLLKAHRNMVLQENRQADLMGEYIALALRMKADGYRKGLDLTPGGLLRMNYQDKSQYEKWLSQNLKPDDPRIQTGAIPGMKSGNSVNSSDFGGYALGFVFKIILYGIDDSYLPMQWKQLEKADRDSFPVIEWWNDIMNRLQN